MIHVAYYTLSIFSFFQDELANLRAKLSEIIEENKRLHEELKTSILQEIVGENIDLEKSEVSRCHLLYE